MTENQSISEYKFRVFYQVTGRLQFLSHKELMRVIVRVLRRARLPLAYSHGYHPHPLLSFGPSLPVGMAGKAEQLDVRLTEPWLSLKIKELISKHLPDGMEIIKVSSIPLKEPSITSAVRSATYEIEWLKTSDSPDNSIAAILSRDKIILQRVTGKGNKEIDLRPGIYDIQWQPPKLKMHLAFSPTMYIRPGEVLAKMTGWENDTIKRISITRTGLMNSPKDTGITQRKNGTRNYYRHGTGTGTPSGDS